MFDEWFPVLSALLNVNKDTHAQALRGSHSYCSERFNTIKQSTNGDQETQQCANKRSEGEDSKLVVYMQEQLSVSNLHGTSLIIRYRHIKPS